MAKKNNSRLVILGLLAGKPMSGYDIKKLIDEAIRFFWNLSYGTIYPTLKKLEKEKLVSKKKLSGENRPDRVIYRITGKGQTELEKWQSERVELPLVNDEMLLKLFIGQKMPIEHHTGILEDYLNKLLDRHDIYMEYEPVCAEAAEQSRQDFLVYLTLRCGILASEARIAWCRETIAALEKYSHRETKRRIT